MDLGFFDKHGYQVVPDLFSPAEIEPIVTFLDKERGTSLQVVQEVLPFENTAHLIAEIQALLQDRPRFEALPVQTRMILSRIVVTGGAGYVGALLVPQLLDDGYEVTVLDLYLYGREVFAELRGDPRFREVEGDIRDAEIVDSALAGADAVIHLACISNDPSFELDPALGKSINLDAMEPLVKASKRAGVRRFVYASSSSVYGIKEEERVTEDLPLEPLTDYSRFKAQCEEIALAHASDDFTVVCVRPATVCGYSPRQRLDVVVNLLAGKAFFEHKVKVFGGTQYRPNIHIEDMVDVYRLLLSAPAEKIQRKVYNAGYKNHTVRDLAEIVRGVVDGETELVVEETDDLRSYRVDSSLLTNDLGFRVERTIEDAARGLVQAFADGRLPDAPHHARYWNIKTMQEVALK
jgi:nucleoside-diphosphate-sugar epimerase